MPLRQKKNSAIKELTAVHGGLYFLVKALCFSEQEVTALNRRPPMGLSSFSEKTWYLATSLSAIVHLNHVIILKKYYWYMSSHKLSLGLLFNPCCYVHLLGFRWYMSGWPSGTSYSSWRPGIWSNSTTCTVTAFPWSYGSSLPHG